ncbi:MAG: tRNA (adenosine(37)-N6)-threonylcarbamoyltransferase complex transferase subunit TsaD [Longimicrobiales bacterium]
MSDVAPLVLGLETSCDETSAAVLRGDRELLGHTILSQDAHAVFGGVVPEIASRAHLRVIDQVVERTLADAAVRSSDLDAIAVTAGPGLIGALLVGVAWAKGAAFALHKPLVAVHHMEAHLFATSLEDPQAAPPFVALLVSGGHTMLLQVPAWGVYCMLGATRDDAAGEAFDKVGKILGLGFPGGPAIEREARAGDAAAHDFPRPMIAEGYDFSFSGLKTAVLNRVRALEAADRLGAEVANLAAAFQEAVIEVLVEKTMRAVAETGCARVVLGGGVAASRLLRERLAQRLGDAGQLHFPSPRLATDNAAMVARAGLFHYQRGDTAPLDLAARADLPFPGLDRGPC